MPGDDEDIVKFHAIAEEVFAAKLAAHIGFGLLVAGGEDQGSAGNILAFYDTAPANFWCLGQEGAVAAAMFGTAITGLFFERFQVVAVFVIAIRITNGAHFGTIIDHRLGSGMMGRYEGKHEEKQGKQG